jgi:hypothetical protein
MTTFQRMRWQSNRRKKRGFPRLLGGLKPGCLLNQPFDANRHACTTGHARTLDDLRMASRPMRNTPLQTGVEFIYSGMRY